MGRVIPGSLTFVGDRLSPRQFRPFQGHEVSPGLTARRFTTGTISRPHHGAPTAPGPSFSSWARASAARSEAPNVTVLGLVCLMPAPEADRLIVRRCRSPSCSIGPLRIIREWGTFAPAPVMSAANADVDAANKGRPATNKLSWKLICWSPCY